jgi:sialate O-acetylesterase
VASRLGLIGMGIKDFLIEDAGGAPDVTKTICAGATVRLELSRPIQGKAHVHGAYGANPEVSMRDLDTNLPMLGFYGLPVKAGK